MSGAENKCKNNKGNSMWKSWDVSQALQDGLLKGSGAGAERRDPAGAKGRGQTQGDG